MLGVLGVLLNSAVLCDECYCYEALNHSHINAEHDTSNALIHGYDIIHKSCGEFHSELSIDMIRLHC